MLSKSSKYAIRAVLFISNNSNKKTKVGSKQIAGALSIPAPFLAKILQELTKKKIISSIKGPNGGFYLTKRNGGKTLFDIIDCIDDSKKFDRCYLGQLECNDENPCVVHHLYSPFKSKLIKKLKTKSIVEMAEEYKRNSNLSEIL